jgi:peptidoglycan hydrolase-like protein with peptidoglycan-binding domain
MKIRRFQKIIFVLVAVCIFVFSSANAKADTLGDSKSFYVESDFDANDRSSVTAVLVKDSSRAYFYVDTKFWNFAPQNELSAYLDVLGSEFDNKIYPTLINTFGSEWSPGIDNDRKITVLFHPMIDSASGYFRSNDEYPKIQITNSNEREMVYVDSKYINSDFGKVFLAHEFTHLITFNQKNKAFGMEEETWLNEARAEYAPNLLGYNDVYFGSYLEERVQSFLEKPSGSLTDWRNVKEDYGRINLFVYYVADHYGVQILTDSLHTNSTGIGSVNYALKKNGFKEDFSQIFSNWTLAVLVNDCSYGNKYCYLDKNLRNFNVLPQVNFLPISGESTLTFADNTKYWSGNWYKIIGGGVGTLKFHFEGDNTVPFKVLYLTKNASGRYSFGTMVLDENQNGNLNIDNFGSSATSFFVIPILQDGNESSGNNLHSFFWSASVARQPNDSLEIQRLEAIIADLKQKIEVILGHTGGGSQGCSAFNNNLYFGLSASGEVKCLQEFLKNQGLEIYPEGLVTGYFGSLTKTAVIRFQQKYASEILNPLGLYYGTGYVGESTRAKINQILANE